MAETAAPGVPEFLTSSYPREATLRNGSRVALRLMGSGDRQAVLTFARSIPANDMLFLRRNITDPAIVDEWVRDIERGHTITILAYDGDRVIGEGDLHYAPTTWTRHIGEIRLLIVPEQRGSGLGRVLAAEIHNIAKRLGLQMLTAQMTKDQPAALAVFRRLGFVHEAELVKYVIDAEGHTRDLIVVTRQL